MARLLKQEEIDALLHTQNHELILPEEAEAGSLGEQAQKKKAANDVRSEQEIEPDTEMVKVQPNSTWEFLTEEEMDSLGEVGNMYMGSAAATLSMLFSQNVKFTSPRLTISTLEDLLNGFLIPHLVVFMRFTAGLSGFNMLIMKIKDANILADLMMGGKGINVPSEANEISTSAAAKALKKMVGTATTSMAAMLNRTVKNSPLEIKVCNSIDDLRFTAFSQEEPVVVVRYKMNIGDMLDTQIMRVMGFETAKEEAGLFLSRLMNQGKELSAPAAEEKPSEDITIGADENINLKNLDAVSKENESGPPAPADQVRQHESAAAVKPVQTPAAVRQVPLKVEPADSGIDQQRLDLILDIPLKVTVLLGRTKLPIKDILGLSPGSVIEMQSLVDEPVEILVNGTLVATGEVVVVNENYGVRISNIITPKERIQNLGC
jgi:flagellar motor switch protein FliN/FliY